MNIYFKKPIQCFVFSFLFSFLLVGPNAGAELADLKTPIVDDAKMLSLVQKNDLIARMNQLKTKNQIWLVIWTIPELGSDSIEEVASQQFKKWEIGEKGKDNGLLLVIAQKNRKVKLEVGYGLEGQIPDIQAKHLLADYLVPSLKSENTAEGLNQLITQLEKIDFENLTTRSQVKTTKPSDAISSTSTIEKTKIETLSNDTVLVIWLVLSNLVYILWVLRLWKKLVAVWRKSLDSTCKISNEVSMFRFWSNKEIFKIDFFFWLPTFVGYGLILFFNFQIISDNMGPYKIFSVHNGQLPVEITSILFFVMMSVLNLILWFFLNILLHIFIAVYTFTTKLTKPGLEKLLNLIPSAIGLPQSKGSRSSGDWPSSSSSSSSGSSSSSSSSYSGGGASGGGGASSDY